MSTTQSTPTISAELHRAIGEVPFERIWMTPFPGTATEDDYIALVADKGLSAELVNGVIVEKPMGLPESFIAIFMVIRLGHFVQSHDLGLISGEHGGYRFDVGEMRQPDFAFVHRNRLPGGKYPRMPVGNIIPNLCVEVLSPSNTRKEMKLKRELYFKAGVELVWMVDPDLETIDVYTSETDFTTLTTADTLDGGTLIPGFTLSVAEIFKADELPPMQGATP